MTHAYEVLFAVSDRPPRVSFALHCSGIAVGLCLLRHRVSVLRQRVSVLRHRVSVLRHRVSVLRHVRWCCCRTMPTRLKDRLVCYILVLCL